MPGALTSRPVPGSCGLLVGVTTEMEVELPVKICSKELLAATGSTVVCSGKGPDSVAVPDGLDELTPTAMLSKIPLAVNKHSLKNDAQRSVVTHC